MRPSTLCADGGVQRYSPQTHQAVIGLHLEKGALVNGAEAHGVFGVARGERYVRWNDVNIGNFHGFSPRRVSRDCVGSKN